MSVNFPRPLKYVFRFRTIYDLILKREGLWGKMLDLERRANAPNRFNNRGGQLLKEEKERNCVRAQLPKIEKQILTLVEEYEKEAGLPFKIDGELVANKIAMDWESHKENRHLQLSAKKEAREQRTPQKSPRSVLSQVTAALRSATPSKKSPTKRKLVAHVFGSSSAKKTKQVTAKIQVHGSTIRRVSNFVLELKIIEKLYQILKLHVDRSSHLTDLLKLH